MMSQQTKVLMSVLKQFNDIQKLSNFNKVHIFELIKIFKSSPAHFSSSLQQAYLKIFKSFLDKANRKIPNKFESLAEALFKQLIDFTDIEWAENESMIETSKLFNSFIGLCIEAIYSGIMNIRIMGARMIFLVVKLVPPKQLPRIMTPLNQESFASGILHLLRMKVSTYRQLGAKLSSLVQSLPIEKVRVIETQLLKIASLDQNQQIRKMVVTNVQITPENIDRILVRLRDKNMEIRSIIMKKLQNQNYILSPKRFNLSQIYKLLYDGYGSKQHHVRSECLNYYIMFFEQNSQSINGKMDVEDSPLSKQKYNKFLDFVRIFRPDLLLINPHLYSLFDKLIQQLIEQLPQNTLIDYLIDLCNRLLKLHNNPEQFSQIQISDMSLELIWLKHCVVTKVANVSTIYKEKCLSGTQLGKLLSIFVNKQELYGTFQLLQYFENEAKQLPDQFGRNEMFNSLQKVLLDMKYFSPIYPLKISSEKNKKTELNIDRQKLLSPNDDICTIPTAQQLHTHKLMLSYYNLPIVSCSLDLIYTLVFVMRVLRPSHYEIQIKEIISELNDPQHNTAIRDKEFIQRDIDKIKESSVSKKRENAIENRLNYLHEKIRECQIKNQQSKEKTRIVILALSKVSNKGHIKDFEALIEENLNKADQSNGLLLLGLECLQSFEQLQRYFEAFWINFQNYEFGEEEQESAHKKNNLLVSLRAITDFVLKFDLLNPDVHMNLNFHPKTKPFSADQFMETLFSLLTHTDVDVKILAVESLCRLLYHQKVHNFQYKTTAFMFLLLLWWSTDSEIITAKCVHTISKFMKCYMDPSAGRSANQIKLAESFCVFFKFIMEQNKEGKRINKRKIIYNLKLSQFMKKAIPVAAGILKDRSHPDRQIGDPRERVYSTSLRAQQLFVLFLLSEQNFEEFIEKTLEISNFYESASNETLVLFKKALENSQQEGRRTTKNEAAFKKFEQAIEEELSDRNQENYDTTLLKILTEQLSNKLGQFKQNTKMLGEKIEQHQLFIENDSEGVSEEDQSEVASENESQSESQSVPQSQPTVINKVQSSEQPISAKNKSARKKPRQVQRKIEESQVVKQLSNSRPSRKRRPQNQNIINLESSDDQQQKEKSASRTDPKGIYKQNKVNEMQSAEIKVVQKIQLKKDNKKGNKIQKNLPKKQGNKVLSPLKEEPDQDQRSSYGKRITRAQRHKL